MESISSDLVVNAINYHGQQFEKIWESEHGEQDGSKFRDVNYEVHNRRNKHLSFQDRGKRLKLQQFMARKADVLYAKENFEKTEIPQTAVVSEDMYAIIPSLETYINVDKQSRLKYFRDSVKIGHLILGTIVSKTQSGMMLKVLCTSGVGEPVHYVADINVKAFCPVANVIPAVDRKGVGRNYMMNDTVLCEVLEVIADTDKIMCGMKGTTKQPTDPEIRPPLGLISADDLPLAYKKALEHKNETYDTVLERSVGFNNPNNISHLSTQLGIDKHCSNISMLRTKFPESEYASELRQQQASKWAYSNVADGIDHFKAGRHTEAFQCLNKALNIDPKNVEGLVARGALYANSGNFHKAIEDFETALKLNPNHANARKYMGETLVALGRSYEEENKFEEAKGAYQSCLAIIPFHEEAQNSLEFLKNKVQPPKNLIEPTELLLPNLSGAGKSTDVNDALKHLLKPEDEEKKDKKKKKKSKKRKNRRRSSSTSSSSSSGSNDSSSSSSSSSSDSSSSSGDSDFKKRKKHRSRSRREKQSSLSPLSKRMAMMDPVHESSATYQFNKPASSTSNLDFSLERPKSSGDSYEAKLRAFLETAKQGDTDYEDKVRKFLEESEKWKKDKKEDKKKKKKKDKKSKKESKKKRKDKKMKRKLDEYELRDALKKELGIKDSSSKRSSKKHGHSDDDDSYLLQKVGYSRKLLESLTDFDDLETKLNAYYALGKDIKRGAADMSDVSPKGLPPISPSREPKARPIETDLVSSMGNSQKWKMHIAAAPVSTSRFKRKNDRDDWLEDPMLMMHEKNGDHMKESPKKVVLPIPEKNMSVRKAMAQKEAGGKKQEPEMLGKKKMPVPPKSNPIPPGQVVLDKFGNFRLVTPPKNLPPMPPAVQAPKDRFDGRGKPPEPPGRPRTESRSPRRSRSHSRGPGKYSRSSSGSRSRSRSYRSRSRSRSRSYSGDRRRRRGGFRGGRFNDRGTYYKPRFQNPRNNYSRGGRGGGGGGNGANYHNRDRYDRDHRGGGGGRGGGRYFNRGRRPRGRFQRGGGYRDFRDRRYDRSRSRDRSRSFSGSRDRDSPIDRDPKKVQQEEKDQKINKYLPNEGEQIRHDGPLSEGEDRDDYSNEKYVDRDVYDGKWADRDESGGGDNNASSRKEIPSETNLEEMDKFLSKAKKDKKEEMLERNKDILKPKV
ncbi:PREDICTED: tetratricopeptide repeat protein 14 isoform X2 [Nicrophorus vespilloides]|uniref:Tetratricopeptide repeat protein 14 isoform X2 n=1 Tax=Nicrophorus vespilloides TaxID=110193 RepID=A0ABM1MRE8_NICVS|nr:PREDICTED: tetratricopeptide repeat protein 14 isoform X2 [Nicrophorus vespilloides]